MQRVHGCYFEQKKGKDIIQERNCMRIFVCMMVDDVFIRVIDYMLFNV